MPTNRLIISKCILIYYFVFIFIGDIHSPTHPGNAAPDDVKKTLLASYPGSGKRFTWAIIKALTNMEVADDWNFSERLTDGSKPIAVKTSWPHKEGKRIFISFSSINI